MNKFNRLYNSLTTVLDSYSRNEIKELIGDSIDNNRTLTVNQVVRFLTTRRNPSLNILGNNLDVTFSVLRRNVLRSRHNDRTDAVDINEFLSFVERRVVTNPTNYRTISQQLVDVSL